MTFKILLPLCFFLAKCVSSDSVFFGLERFLTSVLNVIVLYWQIGEYK